MGDAGFAVGLAIGLAVGFALGRQQKPWNQLTRKEKLARVGLIIFGTAAVVAGIVAFFLFG